MFLNFNRQSTGPISLNFGNLACFYKYGSCVKARKLPLFIE